MLPDSALKQVTGYPELSWAIAAIVVIAFAVTVYRAVIGAPKSEPTKSGGEVNVYFDGPLAHALTALKDISESLLPLRALSAQLKDQHDELGERLRVDRGKIHGRMDDERREIDAELRRQDPDAAGRVGAGFAADEDRDRGLGVVGEQTLQHGLPDETRCSGEKDVRATEVGRGSLRCHGTSLAETVGATDARPGSAASISEMLLASRAPSGVPNTMRSKKLRSSSLRSTAPIGQLAWGDG